MRIAVVTSSYPSHPDDPSGHFVAAEVRLLIEAGHEVTLLVPKAKHPRATSQLQLCELPHAGLFGWPGTMVRLRERPWRVVGLLPFVRGARQRLDTLGPFDRLYAHWILPAFWPICRDFVAETVVVAHGSDVGLLERLPAVLQHPILAALGRDNVTLRCVSTDLATRVRQLCETLYTDAPRIHVEPALLEIPTLPRRCELRRQLGLSTAPMVVVVGRAVTGKRIDLALEAVRAATALAALPVPPSVVAIGGGPEQAQWMRRFPEVCWLGQLGHSDALRHIRAADLLVSASQHEGAPMAIREARSLGTEVVAAKAGDLPAYAASDESLHVVEDFTADPQALACRLIAQSLRRAAESQLRVGAR